MRSLARQERHGSRLFAEATHLDLAAANEWEDVWGLHGTMRRERPKIALAKARWQTFAIRSEGSRRGRQSKPPEQEIRCPEHTHKRERSP